MVDLIERLAPETVAANLQRVREAIADTGRDPGSVEILAAVKYLPAECLAALAEGGVTLVGENRSQQLIAKQEVAGERFTWDFIGALQSRKVRDIVGRVRFIHSVASESALAQLGRHAPPVARCSSRSTSPARRARAAWRPAICADSWNAARSAWSA